MRTKFVRNSRTGHREMIVAAQRGETLHVKHSEKLAEGISSLLLDYTPEAQRGTGLSLLHYDVEGLWSLRTYLAKRALRTDELMGLMGAVLDVIDLCAQTRLPAEGLLFDPEFVFVDAQCSPRFALVPLDNVPFQTRNSPLALLGAIGDTSKLRFESPDAKGVARRLGDLVVDLEGVFSLNRFRRFVEDERHQDGVPDSMRDEGEPGTSSVWASAGSAGGPSEKDDSSLFWSPLAGFVEQGGRERPKEPVPPAQVEPAVVSEPVPTTPEPSSAAPTPESKLVASEATRVPPVVVLDPSPTSTSSTLSQVAPAPEATASDTSSQPVPAPQQQPAVTLVRPATGERFVLPPGRQVRIGRGSACDIRLLGNRKLSRIHAALTLAGQMVVVSGLGAANGVFVDGRRVGSMQSMVMTPGQHLRLADEEFEMLTD